MSHLIKLHFPQANARGVVASLDRPIRDALQHYEIPQNLRGIMAEMAMGAVLLAGLIRKPGTTMIQLANPNAPLSVACVQVFENTNFRIYIRLHPELTITDEMSFSRIVNPDGKTQCSFIFAEPQCKPADMPQSVIPMNGASMSECITSYFEQNDAVPGFMKIVHAGDKVAGILLQTLPRNGGVLPENYDPDGWNRIQLFAQSVKDEELLRLSAEEVAMRLFWQERPTILEQLDPQFQCTCSMERFRSIAREHRDDVLAQAHRTGSVTISCNFCGNAHTWTEEEIKALLQIN